MALDPIVNFFRSTIATLPVASGGTSIVLQTGDGNKLPAPAIDGAFNLTIYNADDPFVAPEIVRVTARSGDTLTVTRAQEGTSATNKTSGSTWNVELTPTAKTIQDIDSAKLDVAGGTMTGDLTIPDKIIHAGDTNTAIRFPANDTVSVETAGTERMRITSDGKIGIGTTSPSYKLDISNPAGSGFRLAGSDIANNALISGATRGIRVGANSTGGFIEGVDNTGVASFQPITIGGLDIRFATSGVANEKMRITGAGNVGIGTTTPATLLDVNGDVTITDKIIHSGDTNTAIRFPSADTVSVETNGSEAFRVDSSQRVGVGTTTLVVPFNVQNTGIIGGTVRTPNANSTTVTIYTVTCNATTVSTQNTIANGTLKMAIFARTAGNDSYGAYTVPFVLRRGGRNTGSVILALGTPSLVVSSGSAGTVNIDSVSVALSSATNTGANFDVTVTTTGDQAITVLQFNSSVELTQWVQNSSPFTFTPA